MIWKFSFIYVMSFRSNFQQITSNQLVNNKNKAQNPKIKLIPLAWSQIIPFCLGKAKTRQISRASSIVWQHKGTTMLPTTRSASVDWALGNDNRGSQSEPVKLFIGIKSISNSNRFSSFIREDRTRSSSVGSVASAVCTELHRSHRSQL